MSLKEISESLIKDISVFEVDNHELRNKLIRETEKQGLRNNDLAEITGWSISKTSKILAGKQKMSSEDVRTWARAIGYTPDPFINEKVTFREYELSKYIRDIEQILNSYVNEEANRNVVESYELPLAILSLLGVSISDYAVRVKNSFFGINSFNGKIEHVPMYIEFWQRTTRDDQDVTPVFGMWISLEKDIYIMSVLLREGKEQNSLKELRKEYKDILGIDEKNRKEFKDFIKSNSEWIPNFLKKEEVYSIYGKTDDFIKSNEIKKGIIDTFEKYCDLIWELKGIDLLPNKYIRSEEMNPFQMYNLLLGQGDFAQEVKDKVKSDNEYKCEIDQAHESFLDEGGKRYMEVVPVIPFSTALSSPQVLLSSANAVCLCPNCKAQIQHGTKQDREDIIIKLYRKHEKILKEAEIDFSLAQVLAANNL